MAAWALSTRDVVLDGELVALDEQIGKTSARASQPGNLHYAVFDVLWLRGNDLSDCPLSRRKRIVSRVVKQTSTVALADASGAPLRRARIRPSGHHDSRE